MHYLRFGWGVIKEAGHIAKKNVGRILRESGLELDRKGSRLTNDIAYL